MPSMTAILATVDPRSMRVEFATASGYLVGLDDLDRDHGGAGPGPMESMLGALAGCAAMDVASILRKKRQAATSYQLAVRGERAQAHPRVYTRITVEHRVSGAVEPEALRRSIELSATRYCPVSAMLSASVSIEHRYRITRDDGTQHEALVAVTGPEGVRVL